MKTYEILCKDRNRPDSDSWALYSTACRRLSLRQAEVMLGEIKRRPANKGYDFIIEPEDELTWR